jgi:hypothetical protein
MRRRPPKGNPNAFRVITVEHGSHADSYSFFELYGYLEKNSTLPAES